MTDSEEIKNTLNRFINSFDLKDWGPMANKLEPRVRIDYAYLRGDPLTEVGATEYLTSRSEAIHSGWSWTPLTRRCSASRLSWRRAVTGM